jgi:hypothetical protein
MKYLQQVLNGMRHEARTNFCVEDDNTRELLLSQCFNKLRGPGSEKNIRALGNLVARFFEPILEELGVPSTTEVLTNTNSDFLFQSLVSFGGIGDFFDNPNSYIDALKKKKVGFQLILYRAQNLLNIMSPTEGSVKGPKYPNA